jgi:hypothetical protein
MQPSNATIVIFIEGGIHEPVARSTAFPVRVASTSSASLSCVNVFPPRGRRPTSLGSLADLSSLARDETNATDNIVAVRR